MPVISRFHGIVIKMFFSQKEHNPPHIHASYGEYVGTFSIEDGNMLEGDIPIKQQMRIQRFILYYQNKLFNIWDTQQFEALSPIE